MRKSIFEIVSENVDIATDVARLITMASDESVLKVGYSSYFTLFDFVDKYCFRD